MLPIWIKIAKKEEVTVEELKEIGRGRTTKKPRSAQMEEILLKIEQMEN